MLHVCFLLERPFNFIQGGGMLWFLLKQYSDPQVDEQISVVKLMTKQYSESIFFLTLKYIFFWIESSLKLFKKIIYSDKNP